MNLPFCDPFYTTDTQRHTEHRSQLSTIFFSQGSKLSTRVRNILFFSSTKFCEKSLRTTQPITEGETAELVGVNYLMWQIRYTNSTMFIRLFLTFWQCVLFFAVGFLFLFCLIFLSEMNFYFFISQNHIHYQIFLFVCYFLPPMVKISWDVMHVLQTL